MGKNIISVGELSRLLGNNNLKIADVRFKLGDPDYGFSAYHKGHIPGAFYLDLEKELSAPIDQHGGRHPLPAHKAIIEIFEKAGIYNSTPIVIYDDAAGMYAGRLWWLLKYAGHNASIQVLDGGWQEWITSKLPIEGQILPVQRSKYTASFNPEMLASMHYVKEKMSNADTVLVDARAAERYKGLQEPIDPKAGHIPGAINRPFSENLLEGKFKSASSLKDQYKDLADKKEIIMYCGSGVSAIHNIIALDEAGIGKVKLYAGSWSDWVSYQDNPVATVE